jgi:hypothetical protein
VPTTVHLPHPLLARIDDRARALGATRNRFIVDALTRAVNGPTEWPPDFVEALKRPVSRATVEAVDQMERLVESGRRNRREPPEL